MNITHRRLSSVLATFLLVASAGCAAEAEGDDPAVAEGDIASAGVETTSGSGFRDCYLAVQVHFPGTCTLGYRTPTRRDSYNCSNGHYAEIVSFSPVPCSNNPTAPK